MENGDGGYEHEGGAEQRRSWPRRTITFFGALAVVAGSVFAFERADEYDRQRDQVAATDTMTGFSIANASPNTDSINYLESIVVVEGSDEVPVEITSSVGQVDPVEVWGWQMNDGNVQERLYEGECAVFTGAVVLKGNETAIGGGVPGEFNRENPLEDIDYYFNLSQNPDAAITSYTSNGSDPSIVTEATVNLSSTVVNPEGVWLTTSGVDLAQYSPEPCAEVEQWANAFRVDSSDQPELDFTVN